VVGVLWDVPKSDWARLERREGAPRVYHRRAIEVKTESGGVVKAFTYVLTQPSFVDYAPSPEYRRLILQSIPDFRYAQEVKEFIITLDKEETMDDQRTRTRTKWRTVQPLAKTLF
jgi:cation transport regulator ChaC